MLGTLTQIDSKTLIGALVIACAFIGLSGFLPTSKAHAQELEPNKEYRLEITRVTDGDTFRARVLPSRWALFTSPSQEIKIRPDDYDSAESRDPTRRITPAEKAAGQRAADALKRILTGNIKFTWSGRKHRDRYIGRVTVGGTDLGILMVTDGMIDQRNNNQPQHSISWVQNQTRRLEWFPR